MNAVLGRFRAAGFSAELTHHAYHALDSHVTGYVLWALPYLAIPDEQRDVSRVLETLPLADLPHLAEHIQQHLDDQPGDTSASVRMSSTERERRGARPTSASATAGSSRSQRPEPLPTRPR